MIVIGETGTLRCDHGLVELFRIGDKEPSQSWNNTCSREENSLENIKQLLSWIETGVEPANSAEDNLKIVAMLEAAYVSAKESRIVQLRNGVLL